MKKTILALAAIALFASACSKENNVKTSPMSFTATIGNVDTKSYLGDKADGTNFYPVLWEAGDQIAVVDEENDLCAIYQTNDSGVKTAVFQKVSGDDLSADGIYSVYYPAANYNIGNTAITVNQEQTWRSNAIAKGGMTMKATVVNLENEIVFTDRSAILKIIVPFSVNKIQLNSTNARDLNDVALVKINGADDAETVNNEQVYYLGVNANTTLSAGSNMVFTFDKATQEKSVNLTTDIALKSSTIITLDCRDLFQ